MSANIKGKVCLLWRMKEQAAIYDDEQFQAALAEVTNDWINSTIRMLSMLGQRGALGYSITDLAKIIKCYALSVIRQHIWVESFYGIPRSYD